jgi:hypothetical protein
MDRSSGQGKPRQSRRRILQWETIETAPKDGTEILCFTRYGDYEISHWHKVTNCWVSKRGFLVEATHWCHLPPRPVPAGGGEAQQAPSA